MGKEAVRIIENGGYLAPSGTFRLLDAEISAARENTVTYVPKDDVQRGTSATFDTVFEVMNETTLSASRRLLAAGYRVAALNFASATNPGGGFLNGARAQEESLCRSSALYTCLVGHKMYDANRQARDPFYLDYVLYSPDVPVFRGDDDRLLETPYLCTFLTAAAVNVKNLRQKAPEREREIPAVMARRIQKVLAVAARHGDDALVLGAWGCGAFGNDTNVIAGLFRDALTGDFKGQFAHITFAVLDFSSDRTFIAPFQTAFASR